MTTEPDEPAVETTPEEDDPVPAALSDVEPDTEVAEPDRADSPDSPGQA